MNKADCTSGITARKSDLEELLKKEGTIIYTSRGTSMFPLILEKRDVLTLRKKTRRLRKYEIGLYRSRKGHYVLHRVRKVRSNSYDFLGDNNVLQEKKIPEERVIGILIKITRDGKEIPLEGNKYERYIKRKVDLYYLYLLRWLPLIILKKIRPFSK